MENPRRYMRLSEPFKMEFGLFSEAAGSSPPRLYKQRLLLHIKHNEFVVLIDDAANIRKTFFAVNGVLLRGPD